MFAVLATNSVYAQILPQVIDEQELEFKVKQIDEFFSRFNYETDYMGNVINVKNDSTANDSIMRRKNLITLLNIENFKGKSNQIDSVSSAFLDYVIKNNTKICYSDSTWYAEAVSSFIMNKKNYPLRLLLKTEHITDVYYKWVIFDALSPIWNDLGDTAKVAINILPGAHSNSFISLPGFINLNTASVRALFHKGYKVNNLTMLDYFISNRNIKLQNITKVIYHFSLDKFNFTVERFERENTYNKGWLISNITINE